MIVACGGALIFGLETVAGESHGKKAIAMAFITSWISGSWAQASVNIYVDLRDCEPNM